MWRSFPLVVAIASLTACATLSNTARSYLTAPNGLQVDDDQVRKLLQEGRADSARRAVGNRKSSLSPDDRLLRLLYEGTSARYAGQYREAGALFDQAFAISEDRYTKSISRTAVAMLSNDYALPYTAGRNERLLLHYNALLAWSAAGDADAAAVEARRLVALLASVGDPDDDERPMRAMLHTVAAAAFEQARDWSDADVARRNAMRLGATFDSAWTPPGDSLGDVLVVVERGDVAHKVAVGLTIPIFSGENPQTNDGSSAAQRMLADFGALRNGGLWWDDTPTWRFTDSRFGAWRGVRASYLLDMSWPVLRRARPLGVGAVQIEADGRRAEGAMTDVSLSDAIAADYRRDRGAIMARTVARAVAKYAAARAVEAAVEASSKAKDADGKKWNTQLVIDPKGKIIGEHRKIYLTKEKGFTDAGTEHKVFEVKGMKMGIAICADGSDPNNIKKLVENGAQIIYGPHANTTGGTVAGWYNFRKSWGGSEGLIAQLKVYAALHNHAGLYNSEFDPPMTKDGNTGWASGSWFIGPDGKTLAQMPTSTQRGESKEFVLIWNVPIPK